MYLHVYVHMCVHCVISGCSADIHLMHKCVVLSLYIDMSTCHDISICPHVTYIDMSTCYDISMSTCHDISICPHVTIYQYVHISPYIDMSNVMPI